MVVDKTMVPFILSNLTQIGAATVEVKEIPLTELKEKEQRVKVISATVSALRLDAVAAAGFGVSRSRMAEEIKGQNGARQLARTPKILPSLSRKGM